MRHHDGGAFVSNVYDLNAPSRNRIPHRLNVAAAKAEDAPYPSLGEVVGDQLCDRSCHCCSCLGPGPDLAEGSWLRRRDSAQE